MRGKVALSEVECISAHVESCPKCEETLQSLHGEDTFAELVRAEAAEIDRPVEAAVQKIIERMRNRNHFRADETVGADANPAIVSAGGTQSLPSSGTSVFIDLSFLAPAQSPDEIGRLGHYRILKVLGKGGMGLVFLAHDPHLDRPIALKVMLPNIAANDSAKQRFLREARAAAKLKNDYIVTIYQVGEDHGVPFLAMEYLEDAPLDQFLADGRQLKTAQILRIGREVARGLADAHERGFIHRDIKPANIWLDKTQAGRAKILDFGLARAHDDIHLTHSGAIVGTPAYMAPEQARGEKVDARADLFSLGCVLYRLCAGDIPFKAETTMGVLMALAMHEPVPPAKINVAIPHGLSDLIMQLLDKDAAKRPASARQVIDSLAAIEKGTPPSETGTIEINGSMPAGPSDPGLLTALEQAKVEARAGQPAPRRRPLTIALACGVAFSFLALLGGIIYIVTDNGTIEIDTADKNVKVIVEDAGGKVIIDDAASKQKWTVNTGKYTIKLGDHADGLEIALPADRQFVMKRGGTQVVAIRKVEAIGKVGGKDKEQPIGWSGKYALQFDGESSYVTVPSFQYSGDTSLTVEAWLELQRPSDKWENLIGNPEVGGFGIGHGRDDGRFFLYLKERKRYLDAFGPPLPRQALIHIAAVYERNHQIRFYVNGKLQGQTAAQGTYKPSIAEFCIGADPPAPGGKYANFFLGRMNGVRISKVARYDKEFTPQKRFEPDKGTFALYHFDDGAGDKLTDSSGNGHHGKIVGAKWVNADGTAIVPPALGKYALAFDGETSYVTIPSFKYAGDHSLTVEAWTVVQREADKLPRGILIANHERAGFGLGFWRIKNSTGVKGNFFLYLQENGDYVNTWGPPIPVNQWIHVAGVYDKDNEARFYLNGKLMSRTLAKGTYKISPADFCLGANPPAPGGKYVEHFFGRMSTVRISKNTRYQGDFTPQKRFEPDADTMALYHCDEGSGDVLKDSSGNGHHGKIVNGKWVDIDGAPITIPADNALEFDGKSYVDIPSLNYVAPTPITMEAWVVPRYANAFAHIFTAEHISLHQYNGLWTTNWVSQGKHHFVRGSDVGADTPVHLAMIWDGNRLQLFVAGKKMGPDQSRQTEPRFAPGALFGARRMLDGKAKPLAPDLFFTGRILGVQLSKAARYDKDFTPARRFAADKDTIALYHFDEGFGDTLKDSSGNGHHGKIVGAKWVKADGSPISDAKKTDIPVTDRHVAEWVIRQRGVVGIRAGGKIVNASKVEQLPAGEDLAIETVVLTAPTAELREFACLNGLPKLHTLHLAKSTDSKASVLKLLSELPGLKSLTLAGNDGSDLDLLTRYENLKTLTLYGVLISDDCVPALCRLKNLKELNLLGTRITPDAVKKIAAEHDLVDCRFAPLADGDRDFEKRALGAITGDAVRITLKGKCIGLGKREPFPKEGAGVIRSLHVFPGNSPAGSSLSVLRLVDCTLVDTRALSPELEKSRK